MDPWLDAYAGALEARLGRPEAGLHLSREVVGEILALAREVAHATERKNAPLMSFIVGRYVSARTADGVDAATALEEARLQARDLLPAPAEGSAQPE
jgi:hypothetical protein